MEQNKNTKPLLTGGIWRMNTKSGPNVQGLFFLNQVMGLNVLP